MILMIKDFLKCFVFSTLVLSSPQRFPRVFRRGGKGGGGGEGGEKAGNEPAMLEDWG